MVGHVDNTPRQMRGAGKKVVYILYLNFPNLFDMTFSGLGKWVLMDIHTLTFVTFLIGYFIVHLKNFIVHMSDTKNFSILYSGQYWECKCAYNLGNLLIYYSVIVLKRDI
jgi:hypothetical protein